jgi:hypothetical protein
MLRKIIDVYERLNWCYERLNWCYERLNWSYERLNWCYERLNWSYERLNWCYERLFWSLNGVVCWYHDKSIIFVSSLLCYPFFSTYTEVPQTQKLLWFSDLYLCLEKVKWHIKVFLHFIQVVLLHAQQKFFRTSQKFFSFFIEQDISQQLLTYFV